MIAARRASRTTDRATDGGREIAGHMVRSMMELLDAMATGEAEWRRAVYSGEAPYSLEDDATRVVMYRRWARAARHAVKAAEIVQDPGRPVKGLKNLKRWAARLSWFIDSPPGRLIDVPGVRLKGDSRKLDVRPLASYLSEHPEHAERLLAADAAVADGTADLTPLSEYLLSRDGR